ncbi:hypothetical protein Btru_003707 [Bulinus truncatus]|nr:hypothetical protein Btru_003707 [Bulinus truncatus]
MTSKGGPGVKNKAKNRVAPGLKKKADRSRYSSSNDSRVSIDEPIPANSYFASHPSQAVNLNMLNSSMAPCTIPSLFCQAVGKYGHRSALVYENMFHPVVITYSGYYTAVLNVANSFIAMGLQPGEVVAMACTNSAYQFIGTLGTIFAGGVYTDLYNFSRLSVLYRILEDSQACFIIVDSTRKMSQIFSLWNELQYLKAVILTVDEFEIDKPNVFTSHRVFENGKPRGVMMSHDNLTFMVNSLKDKLWTAKDLEPQKAERQMYMPKRFFSFLSHSWAFGLVIEILLPIASGTTVFFGGPDVWKGKMVEFLKLVKPNIFFATSRIWILLHEKINERFRRSNFIERFWIKKLPNSYSYYLKKVHYQRIGKVRSEEGPYHLNTSRTSHPGFMNTEIPGCLTKHVKLSELNENQKLLVTGRHVCMGVLHDWENYIVADNNYIDINITAQKDENDNLMVTGSTLGIISLSNGCQVQCFAVEQLFKNIIPVISNCMLVGPHKPFLSLLITLKTTIDPVNRKPQSHLTLSARNWLERIGILAVTTLDLSYNKFEWKAMIDEAVSLVNRQLDSKGAWIKRWTVLEKDFSVPDGEIDPLTKTLNRNLIMKKYHKEIEGLCPIDVGPVSYRAF